MRNWTLGLAALATAACATTVDAPSAVSGLGLVLITNDDGVEDLDRLDALADAVARAGGEPFIVATRDNRSSFTSVSELARTGAVTIEKQQRDGAPLYISSGYPADSVIAAYGGLHDGRTPDLVLSGINGGQNQGQGWFFSGTVGAARMAALLGIPAVALSGVDEDDPETEAAGTAAIADWAVRFAASDMVRGLGDGEYLTVAFPVSAQDGVEGIRVAPRERRLPPIGLEDEGEGEWSLVLGDFDPPPAAGADIGLLSAGYVVVTPLSVREDAADLSAAFRRRFPPPPAWSTD